MSIRKFSLVLALCAASLSVAACGDRVPPSTSIPPAGGQYPGDGGNQNPHRASNAVGNVVDTVSSVAGSVTLHSTQALIVAEETYQAANRVALAAVQTGLLPDGVLRQIRSLNQTAINALDRARRATTDVIRGQAAAEAFSAALNLRSLVPH